MRRLPMMFAPLLLAGCSMTVDRPAVLTITEISAPAEVAVGAALHLSVTVQSGGCVSFDRMDVERSPSRVTLVARGLDHSSPTTMCPTDIRWTQSAMDVASPLGDPFTIVAVEPDGTTLERVVRVR